MLKDRLEKVEQSTVKKMRSVVISLHDRSERYRKWVGASQLIKSAKSSSARYLKLLRRNYEGSEDVLRLTRF